jgi:hypothetical protein
MKTDDNKPKIITAAATSSQPEPFVDAVTAGRFLSLRPRRVLELARKGEIPAHPLGKGLRRVWRFRLSELALALCTAGVESHHAAVRAREDQN